MTDQLRSIWENTVYKYTCIYVSALVTAILALQVHRYFFVLPGGGCTKPSALSLVPVLGVFL